MMDPKGRYAAVETATLTSVVQGEPQLIRYLRRRFVPTTTGLTTLVKHPVKQGDRVDSLAALYFTDPTLFWRICDANAVLNPDELVATPGRSLVIALPLR